MNLNIYIHRNSSKYNINNEIKNLVALAAFQVLSSHMWLMPPRHMWNISTVAGSSLGQGCPFAPWLPWSSRSWALLGEPDGMDWAGQGWSRDLSPGEGGVCPEPSGVDSSVPEAWAPGWIKPEPVTREWPGRAAHRDMATQVPARNV